MRISFGRKTTWAALCVAALAAAFVVATSLDAKVDPRTYDLKRTILGKSAGQWTAEWWQWIMSIPGSMNPNLDTTGTFLQIGQRGPVWFLPGVFTSASVTRTATIPSGKSLLFAVNNTLYDYLDPTTQTPSAIRTAAAKVIDAVDASTLTCTLDGVPVSGLKRNRVVSSFFEYATPDDGPYLTLGTGFPGGVYKPAITDGYWVFFKPLAVGQHTIRSQSVQGTLAINVTYELTVVDHDKP